MKKKIGDLTLKEILRCHEMHKCNECGLNLTILCQIACIIKAELIEDVRYLEQKIEVKEDESNSITGSNI